jgi:hypothetical protein
MKKSNITITISEAVANKRLPQPFSVAIVKEIVTVYWKNHLHF